MAMGRAEDRKAKKFIKSKMTEEQFKRFESKTNVTLIKTEVEERIKFYQDLWIECLEVAFKNNGISDIKARMILEDVEREMKRKVAEKKNGKNKA